MKMIIRNMLFGVISALTVLIPTGCSDIVDEPVSSDTIKSMTVNFRVVLSSAPQSRGTLPGNGDNASSWNEFTGVEGKSFENKLLSQNFTVTLYNSTDNSYLGKVSNFYLNQVSSEPNSEAYRFTGFLDFKDDNITEEYLQSITAKLMITANSEPTESQKTLALNDNNGLTKLTFEKIGQEKDVESIPMWGITTKSLSGIRKGTAFDFGDIALLRAMAKVEVKFSSKITNAEITGITLENISNKGYVLPMGTSATASIANISYTSDVPMTVNVPMQQFSTFGPYREVNDRGAVVFYLPELLISGTNPNPPKIIVTYQTDNGETGDGTIRFCEYDESGNPTSNVWNVVRNHYYSFEITNIPNDGLVPLKIKYNVRWWDEYQETVIPPFDKLQ